MAVDYHYTGMYDADNHLYENEDAFTRFLPNHRRSDLFWTTDGRNHRHLIVNGRLWDYIPNPTFDPIAVPGCLTEMFEGEKTMNQVRNDGYRLEPLADRPEYQNPDARLRRLDAQGVDAALMFPTLVSGLEEQTTDNPELTVDLLWAFNRWLSDEWGFAHQGRIFVAPVISLVD